MPHVLAVSDELPDAAKILDALHRGVPKTRMLDYGLNGSDALTLNALRPGGLSWEQTAERLAAEHVAAAEDDLANSRPAAAAQRLEWAGAVLTIGQLALNHDTPAKHELLSRAIACYDRAASLSDGPHQRITLSDGEGGKLYGWSFPVPDARGCVLVLGGLSGWGNAYFGIARAFNTKGLAAILVEGPGQGLTRLKSQIFLSRATLPSLSSFVDAAVDLGGDGGVGIMGNSFGGLIAAHVAAADDRIDACCINGAVPTITVPQFRTAREQMEAAFGSYGATLEKEVAAFCFDATLTPIKGHVLLLEGGVDPLVSVGAQAGFGVGARSCDTVSWADGEHTIYNYAADRNGLVGAWFVDHLKGGRAL